MDRQEAYRKTMIESIQENTIKTFENTKRSPLLNRALKKIFDEFIKMISDNDIKMLRNIILHGRLSEYKRVLHEIISSLSEKEINQLKALYLLDSSGGMRFEFLSDFGEYIIDKY